MTYAEYKSDRAGQELGTLEFSITVIVDTSAGLAAMRTFGCMNGSTPIKDESIR